MSTCKTVKIVAGDGYAIINESDFDPKVHEMYGKKPKAKKKPATKRKPAKKS